MHDARLINILCGPQKFVRTPKNKFREHAVFAHTAWRTRTGRNRARRFKTSTKPFTVCQSEFSFESCVFLELPKPCLATSIIKIIEHRGTVVRELDNRKGHRKDAVRSQLTEQLTPEALAGLEEQLAASVGMSGPPGGC